mgnify:CR=1 FL=1
MVSGDLGIQFTDDEVVSLMQRFDNEGSNRRLKYSEFCDAFAPKHQPSLKDLASRVPRNMQLTMSFERMFSENTKNLYREVWYAHARCEGQCDKLRQDLLRNPFFDL